MHTEQINIVITCDDDFIQHMGIMLISLLKNTTEPQNINIFFLDHGIKQQSKDSINRICSEYRAMIQFLEIDGNVFEDFYISHHINQVTYYRIIAPLTVPRDIKRVLYLDGDVIVEGDIKELFRIDLNNQVIGAIPDPYGIERIQELDIPNSKYFNAGILLIDVEKWNSKNLTKQLLDYIQNNNTLKYWDQDALNANLYDLWEELPLEWNYQTAIALNKEYSELSPKIIHYTEPQKPWQIFCRHPYSDRYYKYIEFSEWKLYNPIPDTIQQLLNEKEYEYFIFGTGELAKSFYTKVTDDKIIQGFIDNDSKRWGSNLFNNKFINSPNVINEFENIRILVCSSYFEEIKKQLESDYNKIENIDFFKVSY